jgi:uncharacterized protein YkwD
MAKKVALFLLAGVVVSAMGVGAAIGVHLGGGSLLGVGGGDGGAAATPTPSASPTDGPVDPSPTPAVTATPVATSTSAATVTPSPSPESMSPDEFDEGRIEQLVRAAVNDRRRARGLEPLRMDGRLREMAGNHSRRLDAQGYLSHAAGGDTTEERYRRNGLHDDCGVADDNETSIRTGDALETLAKVSAGSEFGGSYNRDERAVAVDAVSGWFDEADARRKLTYENAGRLGVGVHVGAGGRAYVTVDLCT